MGANEKHDAAYHGGKEVSKWSDQFMFTAEPSQAAEGPRAYLLGGPADPLGQIAACAKMYKGEVVRDLRDVTDAERREYLVEIQKTVLKMPLEAVSLHFMLDNITRSITHQVVRQRTAAFAQESMRFAVKEDMASAVALPPSLEGTLSEAELLENESLQREIAGLGELDYNQLKRVVWESAKGAQRWRLRWDQAVEFGAEAYLDMINDGMPAEDARGLAPHNVTTRMNYITNLRAWYDTMANRVSDQAQFEWRNLAMQMVLAMREFGERTKYEVWLTEEEFDHYTDVSDFSYASDLLGSERGPGGARFLIRKSSAWQYTALSNELKPVEFKIGGPAFGANFDRPSRIAERVREFHKNGVPSSEWTTGSVEHGIPPIHPEEWLLDPNSARLAADEEFDVFGNRVPKGTGLHFVDKGIIGRTSPRLEAFRWPRDFVNGEAVFDEKPGVDMLDVEIEDES
jgi:thymidylate synthase (FAD)